MRYEWRSWNHTLQPSYSKVIQACWRLADTYLIWRERQHSLCFKAHKMNILIWCSNHFTLVIVVLDVTLVCPQNQTNKEWLNKKKKKLLRIKCLQVWQTKNVCPIKVSEIEVLSPKGMVLWDRLIWAKTVFPHVWKRFHYSIVAEQSKSKLNICWLQRIIGRRTYWMQMNLTLCWSLLYMLLSVCLCSYTTLNDATPPI